MATKMFKAVILGAPASGKGTISSRIVKKFNLVHVSSGDQLRLNIQKKTGNLLNIQYVYFLITPYFLLHAAIGLEAEKYIKQGKLVPDELMINFIKSTIKNVNKLLLDGFPRTVSQAQSLWKEEKLDLVLNLVVPFDVIIERVKGRWIHLPSGRVYNIGFNSPKVPVSI